jgi:protoporphyrinogen oxidase
MTNLSRRELLSLISKASCAAYASPLIFGGCNRLAPWLPAQELHTDLSSLSPIDRSLEHTPAQSEFFGDTPSKAHSLLWNKAALLAERGGIPRPSEYRPIVVVGGGISGLTSAYLLRDQTPLVLEQATRMGGNSKGQSWRGIDYSIGAAYFCVPEPNSPTAKLFQELGLSSRYRLTDEAGLVATHTGLIHDFWSGAALPEAEARQVKSLVRYLKAILEEESFAYPEPSQIGSSSRKSFERLDTSPLRTHLERVVGPLSPTLGALIEQYCWSSFAASASEISAASGLNFLASEFGPIAAFPGGNSAVAETLCEHLLAQLPQNSLRTNATVVDVRVQGDRALVSYIDNDGQIISIETSAVIMACPKFIVAKILDDVEPSRVSAIQELEYRAYIVANVLLKGAPAISAYDLYLLGKKEARGINPQYESATRGVTDVVNAHYARGVPGFSVLTLYRAYPYRDARAQLLHEGAYETVRAEILQQLTDEIAPLYGFTSDAIQDVRIARWGHPISVSRPGLVRQGVSDALRKPFRDRVFFVEQDNVPLPAIETALGEAFFWSDQVRSKVATSSTAKKFAF